MRYWGEKEKSLPQSYTQPIATRCKARCFVQSGLKPQKHNLHSQMPQSVMQFRNWWVILCNTKKLKSGTEEKAQLGWCGWGNCWWANHTCTKTKKSCRIGWIGAIVSTVASQRDGSWLESQLGPFFVELACSACACVGSLRVLWSPPQYKNMHIWIISDSKLTLEVNVNVVLALWWTGDLTRVYHTSYGWDQMKLDEEIGWIKYFFNLFHCIFVSDKMQVQPDCHRLCMHLCAQSHK